MKVAVKILPPADGKRQDIELELPEGASIQDAIDELAFHFGEKKLLLVNEKGGLIPAWRVFLNDRMIDNTEDRYYTISLDYGDKLLLLLALAGG